MNPLALLHIEVDVLSSFEGGVARQPKKVSPPYAYLQADDISDLAAVKSVRQK